MTDTSSARKFNEIWSIADVERDTNLSKDTLRVWERRYGFPCPDRDNTGNRIYARSQIERLMLIKRLLDAGHRPNKVVPLDLESLQNLLKENKRVPAGKRKPLPPLSGKEDFPWDEWYEQLISGRTDTIRSALRQQIWRHGLIRAIEHVIAPLTRYVGEAWHNQTLTVYQEHLYSETVQSLLREALTALDSGSQPDPSAPKVLLTTLAGERHGLGLLMAECCFALERCTRHPLGLDIPVDQIVMAAAQYQSDVIGISLSAHTSGRDTLDQLDRLSQALPPHVEIWLGGSSALFYNKRLPASARIITNAAEIPAQITAWGMRHGQAKTAALSNK